MSLDKQKLRKKYKHLRLSLSAPAVDERSLEICRNLYKRVAWNGVKKICCYQAIDELNEVNLNPLIDVLEYKHPNIKIKVLAPTKHQPLPKLKFDVIIVPCLVFDEANYRLGWGSGFYDRFLAGQPQALKVGVAYQNSLVAQALPRQPHDIPMDIIITER